LSVTCKIPVSEQMSEIALRSVSFKVGLAGVSVNTMRVVGRTRAATASGSAASTKETSTPNRVRNWSAKR